MCFSCAATQHVITYITNTQGCLDLNQTKPNTTKQNQYNQTKNIVIDIQSPLCHPVQCAAAWPIPLIVIIIVIRISF